MKKINRKLLPIKAHFFFFMAAMGPVLPQLGVYGKELGISSVVMGSVTGVLPILFLIGKLTFGVLVDVFRNYRKAIFLTLIVSTSVFYGLLSFIPARFIMEYTFTNISSHQLDTCNVTDYQGKFECNNVMKVVCNWISGNFTSNASVYGLMQPNVDNQQLASHNYTLCLENLVIESDFNFDINCLEDIESNTGCLYRSFTFWGFIILMSLGTIGFNVLNSISDAICFDIVGDEHDYGQQRVWGTYGFGLSALLSGYIIDYWFGSQLTYVPAFVVMIIFTLVDFIACIKLELPIIEAPKNIFKDLKHLLNNKHTIIFIIYATMAGIVDSFIIYFLFWYLEDLALATNTTNIKLLEGLTVAAETLGSEVIFFYLSGKIIERFGHAYSFSMCFMCYGLRFGLISAIPSPWWILPIELALQGPTYALIYTTIVAYANAIAPPGMSATVQGIAAGMDDCLGYSIGSIIGGFLYKYIGGKGTLHVFCVLSLICGVSYLILHKTILQKRDDPVNTKMRYLSPEDALISALDGEDKKVKIVNDKL